MSNKMKLKRIVDLFSEGNVCFLGDDESAKPVCVWINKNNSIEEEEARMDSQSARTELLLAMASPMHPEMAHLRMIMDEWSDDEMFEAAANHKYEESTINALADVEADKEWTEKLEYLRRQPELLDDANVTEDDPRRAQLEEYNKEYMAKVTELVNERQEKALAEVKAKGRETVEEEFVKMYKDKLAIDHYILEGRITKLYFATRECDAERAGEGEWKHDKCDHSKRLFSNRSEVREMPEHVLTKILETFDNLTVGARNVANFPEPQNSSESSASPKDAVA
jgi:hypothetical protein